MSKTSSISSIIYEIESYIKHSKKESFTFKLNELPFHDNYSMDIRKHNQFIPLFQLLNSKKHHCLYWFSTSTEKLIPSGSDLALVVSMVSMPRSPKSLCICPGYN